jgi:hypothetical protein
VRSSCFHELTPRRPLATVARPSGDPPGRMFGPCSTQSGHDRCRRPGLLEPADQGSDDREAIRMRRTGLATVGDGAADRRWSGSSWMIE